MDSELQEAFQRLASITSWGCVWFNSPYPSPDMDMYRVEIMETDVGNVRLVHVGGDNLIEVINEALREYEAQRRNREKRYAAATEIVVAKRLPLVDK